MNITVEIKNVYGNNTVYPVCHAAKIFAEIAGTKTLTFQAIQSIKALGFKVIVQQPLPVTL